MTVGHGSTSTPSHPSVQTNLDQRLALLLEQLSWIGDMARPHGTPGNALVRMTGVACGPLAPLPRPLDSFAHICHHFGPFLL